ncbi:AraC family transcriptional regulator [Mucilaginibacter galii]|uniref:AraC family transcriptional regulator n=1 Tax=Mucilaginibacter galii TaxID=2005073 RepID=A0A917J9K0_9SPHI|nr:AraC family transcriptional regulator [Mucilaginibacter galii]GGI51114.1 AraC family transcriptional regulator [Mucilaginibacter galii]
MKISITDDGSGITKEFARAIGATILGRFVNIPESKGSGYLTGFAWGRDLRMMIRNYHLKEDVFIERTNELAEGQEDIIFLLSGIFPSPIHPEEELLPEQANMVICRHAVSSIIAMPRNTAFKSVTIAASKHYLQQMFAHIEHPVVSSVLEATNNFIFETGISAEIITTASEMLLRPVPESMESQYCKLKCKELLCHIFTLLMQQDAIPSGNMHINDIKAIYAIKTHLLAYLHEPPNVKALAKNAGMSEPKLRKLFKHTFGKGVFEYYQFARMQKAAQLLREKRLSVAEVGYQVGFTNLSHFSRVFTQHTGSKPKRYSSN